MNNVGRYSQLEGMDKLMLMNMVLELPEKDRMLMWVHGYIDIVIEKLPSFAKIILQERKLKWEDTKEYFREQVTNIGKQNDFLEAAQKTRKEFALFVQESYPQYQSLLFRYYDGNLNELDLRKFVFNRRFGHKRYLQ